MPLHRKPGSNRARKAPVKGSSGVGGSAGRRPKPKGTPKKKSEVVKEVTILYEAPDWIVKELTDEEGNVIEVECPDDNYLLMTIWNTIPMSLRNRVNKVQQPDEEDDSEKANAIRKRAKALKVEEFPVVIKHKGGKFHMVKPGYPSVIAFHTWAFSHGHFTDLRKIMYEDDEDALEYDMGEAYEKSEREYSKKNRATEMIEFEDEPASKEIDEVRADYDIEGGTGGEIIDDVGEARSAKTMIGRGKGRKKGTFNMETRRYKDVGNKVNTKAKHGRGNRAIKKKEEVHKEGKGDAKAALEARKQEIERRKQKRGQKPKKPKVKKIKDTYTVPGVDMDAAIAKAKAEMEKRMRKGDEARAKTGKIRKKEGKKGVGRRGDDDSEGEGEGEGEDEGDSDGGYDDSEGEGEYEPGSGSGPGSGPGSGSDFETDTGSDGGGYDDSDEEEGSDGGGYDDSDEDTSDYSE